MRIHTSGSLRSQGCHVNSLAQGVASKAWLNILFIHCMEMKKNIYISRGKSRAQIPSEYPSLMLTHSHIFLKLIFGD